MGVKHFLTMPDLSATQIGSILDRAEDLKRRLRDGEPHELLHGKTLGMIFAKPSTRTRVSFEAAMAQLGGHAIYLGMENLQLSRGETIADTARTLSRYLDAVVARLFDHGDLVELARHSSIPVINGLTDLHHPCQTLADLLTIREHKGKLGGLKVAWVGDGNNVCNSMMLGCSLMGMDISVACPKGYEPPAEIVGMARKHASEGGTMVEILREPKEAVRGADVVYTDVFVSMGMEKERARRLRAFRGYRVDSDLLNRAKADAIFMHCLPAHRGEEVTDEVIDGPRSVVFDQAENRLHAQKALLLHLML